MTNPTTFQPQPLTGVAGVVQNARMGVSLLVWLLSKRRERGMSFADIINTLKRAALIADVFSEYKPVRFGRRVFSDAFSPPWPEESFFEALTSFGTASGFTSNTLFAITSRCMFRCKHCYAANSIRKEEVLSRDDVLSIVDQICRSRVGVLSLEGGEPMLRYDVLLDSLKVIGGRAVPFIATTGWNLDERKAAELAGAGLVAAQISLDHYIPERHNKGRGNARAFETAVKAVELFRNAGVFPILAVCATKDLIQYDGLFRYLKFAKEIGAGMIQLLDPLPSGRYLTAKEDVIFSSSEIKILTHFHRIANTQPEYRDYPGVNARAHQEHEDRFGCGMGHEHYSIDAAGNVQPCTYVQMSVGNVLEEKLDVILERMRRVFPKIVGGLCPAYELSGPISEYLSKGADCPLGIEYTEKLAAMIMKRDEPKMVKKMERLKPHS